MSIREKWSRPIRCRDSADAAERSRIEGDGRLAPGRDEGGRGVHGDEDEERRAAEKQAAEQVASDERIAEAAADEARPGDEKVGIAPPEVGLEREVEEARERREARRYEENRDERLDGFPSRAGCRMRSPRGEGGDEHGTRQAGRPLAVAAAEQSVAPREPRGRGREREDGR